MIDHPRVLIVEDEQIVAEDLKQTLSDLGYQVAGIADTGEAAVKMARQANPGIVLMDIYLPGAVDGVAAAQQISGLSHIPVVFLTANSDEEVLARARAAEPYGYLLKPYRAQELDATIRVALQRHHAANELFAKHQWLRAVLASLSDGVAVSDTRGRIRYLNPVAEELTGWSLQEAVEKQLDEVFKVTDLGGAPTQVCQLQKAVAALKPAQRERFILHSRLGRRTPIEDSAAPIFNDQEELMGAVSIFHDISDRLRREREQAELKDRLEEQVHSATLALGQTRTELRALSAHLMNAQEEERRWLARELHDDFAQRTAFVEMQATRALSLVGREDAELRELLRQMCDQVAGLSAGLRNVSHRLHPSILVDLGVVSAIRMLIEEFRDMGVEASARLPESCPELGLESATALYRITQEALRNAMRHAPGAPVRVTLDTSAAAVQLSVDDAGPGFELSYARGGGGLGLVSMQERARHAGGTLLIRTRPGEGTTITASIPVSRA